MKVKSTGVKPKQAKAAAKAVKKQAAPASIGTQTRNIPATLNWTKNGGVRVRHREYIGEVPGTATPFAIALGLQMNPGLASVFPWLSRIASNYEAYKIHKLHYCFESEAPSSMAGFVGLGADYDASDPAPASKPEFMNLKNAVRANTWQSFVFTVDVASAHGMGKRLYVRTGPLAANLDVKTYDAGSLYTCVGGQAVTTSVGELYADYDIELFDPQALAPVSSSVSTMENDAFSVLSGPTVITVLGTPFATVGGFPASSFVGAANGTINAGLDAYSAAGTINPWTPLSPAATQNGMTDNSFLIFQPGVYRWNYTVAGTTLGGLTGMTFIGSTNCTSAITYPTAPILFNAGFTFGSFTIDTTVTAVPAQVVIALTGALSFAITSWRLRMNRIAAGT